VERVSTRISPQTAGIKRDERVESVLKIHSQERTAEAKIACAVAGFDLTFSALNSVSASRALADKVTQAVVFAAHQQSLAYVAGYAEQCVFTSRSGKNGVDQEELRGMVGTAFDHWDSRPVTAVAHACDRDEPCTERRRRMADAGLRGMFRATGGPV
jgi:hypothetical protein